VRTRPGQVYGRRWYRPISKYRRTPRKIRQAHVRGANYFTDVWVNGKWAGCHEGGYTPFAFDISKYVNYGKDNVVAVRVDNIPWIPHGDSSSEAQRTNGHNIIPYATCDWWNYGGITRDVYLEISPAVSVVRADIKAKPSGDKDSEIGITVVAYNSGDTETAVPVSVKVLGTNMKQKEIENLTAKKISTTKAMSVKARPQRNNAKPGRTG
jgi:beta-galactosidase/beta-glucuronidase